MAGVQDFTLSANGNLNIEGFGDPGPISVAENCPAANLNNAVRALMSDVMQELAYQGSISASASMSLAGVSWRFSAVSGSASIIHVGTGRAGLVRNLYWNGPSTLVGSANIITDGGGNIVTATNDMTVFTSLGSGAWRAVHQPVSGIPPALAYSTGTFTPTLTFGGAAVGMTYTVQTGAYVKIGSLVFFNIVIQLLTKGSSTGQAIIGGLPFTSTSAVINPVTFFANASMASLVAGGTVIAQIANAATTITPWLQTTTTIANLTDAHFGANASFGISGCYLT